jgi:hypothetical protein
MEHLPAPQESSPASDKIAAWEKLLAFVERQEWEQASVALRSYTQLRKQDESRLLTYRGQELSLVNSVGLDRAITKLVEVAEAIRRDLSATMRQTN